MLEDNLGQEKNVAKYYPTNLAVLGTPGALQSVELADFHLTVNVDALVAMLTIRVETTRSRPRHFKLIRLGGRGGLVGEEGDNRC